MWAPDIIEIGDQFFDTYDRIDLLMLIFSSVKYGADGGIGRKGEFDFRRGA